MKATLSKSTTGLYKSLTFNTAEQEQTDLEGRHFSKAPAAQVG